MRAAAAARGGRVCEEQLRPGGRASLARGGGGAVGRGRCCQWRQAQGHGRDGAHKDLGELSTAEQYEEEYNLQNFLAGLWRQS